MSVWDGIKGVVGGAVVGGPAGAMIGGMGGAGLGDKLAPTFAKPAPPPDIDPRLKEIRDRQFGLSSDFRNKAPGMIAAEQTQAGDQSKEDLTTKRMQITQGANQRGMLFSGLKKSAEANAGQMAASDLAQRRMDITKNYDERQQMLEQRAFDSGAKLQQMEQARFDTQYNQEMDAKRLQLASNTSPVGLIGGGLKAMGGLLG